VDNIVAVKFDELFEFRQFSSIKWTLSCDFTDSDFDKLPILKNDFRFAFSVLVFSVNMNRLMFVGIKQDSQAKILIKFGQCSGGCFS